MAEVVLLSGAEDDALSIYFELFDKSEERAERFSSAVDRSLSDLAQFPEIGMKFEAPFRRKLVPGFYEFGVFYTVEGTRIMVHAILNLRQDPRAIRRRLGLDR